MEDSRVKKGVKNTIFSIVNGLIVLILGLIVPRIVVISYGSETNGLLSSTTQLLTYLALFEAGVSTIMNNSLYQEIAKKEDGNISGVFCAGVKYYRKLSIYYGFALLVSASLFSFFLNSNIPRITVFFVVLLSGAGSVLCFNFSSSIKNLISANGDYYYISVVDLIVRVLNYVVTIVAALFTLNIVVIKAIALIVTMIQVMIYNSYFIRNYSWIDKQALPVFDNFKQRGYYIIHQIASLLFSSTDVMLLAFFTNLTIVSIYTVYNSVISSLSFVLNSIISSFLFLLGQLYAEGLDKYIKAHDAFKLLYIELTFILSTVCYFLFVPFIELYMRGADAAYADEKLAFLFCCITMLNACRSVDNQLAAISWHVKQTTSHVVMEAIINLVVSILLVRKIGIYGVLLGTIFAVLFRVIISSFYSEREILHRKVINGYKHAIVNGVIFISLFLIYKMCRISIVINSYMDFVLIGVIILLIVALIYAALNILIFKTETTIIITSIKSRRRR